LESKENRKKLIREDEDSEYDNGWWEEIKNGRR
jgi:hypothetical protein